MTKIHLQNSFINTKDESLPLTSAKTLVAIQNRLVELESKYPGILQEEMFDFLEVMEMGAEKYACNNWLEPDGKKASEKDMHDSMFHHLAESFANRPFLAVPEDVGVECTICPTDRESGLDPLLHLACRALMLSTRRKRDIRHQDDKL